MHERNAHPPRPANLLFENLFLRRKSLDTLKVISVGLSSFVVNSSRLIADVDLLECSARYPSASFLLATADEEMAKSYILLDACRLDFSRHQDVLKGLCRAFYNHVAKHAYNKVLRFPNLRNMTHVNELWDVEVTRWWPSSDPESGEPDMPHDTYFAREMPLYVDFIDYDQDWFVPKKNTGKVNFEDDLDSRFSESEAALERLRRTHNAGLYRPECLAILNETFRNHHIKEDTPNEEIIRLEEQTAEQIEKKIGIPRAQFCQSALSEWPLYHFVVSSKGM